MNLTKRIDGAVLRLSRSMAMDLLPSEPPWVVKIETKIGGAFPEDFRYLITHYSFDAFVLGPVELFANRGDGADDDITKAPFRDPLLSNWLNDNRFFHFARSSCGSSYDPICLDLRNKKNLVRTPILRFDHEALLCERSVIPRRQLAVSFLELLLENCD